MIIREAIASDLEWVLAVERAAFGSNEEANLVKYLLADPSAEPIVSLLAFDEEEAVGHILFTRARLEPEAPLSISILAPLAVVPDYQDQGIGGKLIEDGITVLKNMGTDLVFVLGHPGYYPRSGFQPAGKLGYNSPFPIPEKDADAWMVRALRPEVLGYYRGTVICADAMNRPEYWRE